MKGNSQHLLLQAALAESGQALSAWREWLSMVDWERNAVDPGCFSLLPLVYRNLACRASAGENCDAGAGKDNGDGLGRLRGIYRRSWVVNEISLRSIESALARLGEEGISCLLPDGVALALRFYPHPACRPVLQQTIWLEPDPAGHAVQTLVRAGWQVATRLPRFLAARRNQVRRLWPLLDESGCLLLLRTRLQSDQDPWQASDVETMSISAGNGKVLTPAGQLLELGRQARLCPRGLRPSLLADAACLIRSAQPCIDWSRVRLDDAAMALLQQLALIGPEWKEAWRGVNE